ncbi:MAG: hypothetical protein KDK40_01080 [Chlamydiia bacterium]|nr:hypothetical protein [Chlamydiia bacterium]
MPLLLLLLSLIFTGCHSPKERHTTSVIVEGSARAPLYRFFLPEGWRVIFPDAAADLSDTTQPLCTCLLEDMEGKMITITFHHFPTSNGERRIPPASQLARWRRQFQLEASDFDEQEVAWGGFYGRMIVGEGWRDEPMALQAWSLLLCDEEYARLLGGEGKFSPAISRQMAADVTIKAWGDPLLMEKRRSEVVAIAGSFGLLHPLPPSR